MDAFEYMTNRWTNPFKFMAIDDSDNIGITEDPEHDKPRHPSGCLKGTPTDLERTTRRPIPRRR